MLLKPTTTLLSISICGAALLSQGASAAQRKPNILFIAVDDLNTYPHIMNGESSLHTPNLERLAKKGVLFTNAHCAAPSSGPSRASIITGIAPYNSGVYMNNQDWRECTNLADRATIPDHFRANGYTTLGAGKIYHGSTLSENALCGLLDSEPWDEFYPSKSQQLFAETLPEPFPANTTMGFYNGYFDWAPLNISNAETGDGRVVEWAEAQLSRTHDKPLFLAVGLYKPHIPWYLPKEYYDRHPLETLVLPEMREDDYDDIPAAAQGKCIKPKMDWNEWIVSEGKLKSAVQGYYASVSFMDDMLGRLCDALENGPLADNTIVVLWSDHGYHTGQKQHWEKYALWEQTTRIPFIVVTPDGMSCGEVCNQPVSLLDLYPTLVELSGTKSDIGFDGRSIVPEIKNPHKATGRGVITTQFAENHAYRTERWRYIRYADGSEELYDQYNDKCNFTNLASDPKYRTMMDEFATHLPKSVAAKNPAKTYKQ